MCVCLCLANLHPPGLVFTAGFTIFCLFVCSALQFFFTYVINKNTSYGQAITEGSSLIGEIAIRLCVPAGQAPQQWVYGAHMVT